MEKFNSDPLMLSDGKNQTPLRAEYLSAIVEALAKLERSSRRSMDEMEKQIYIDELRDLTVQQVEYATRQWIRTKKGLPQVSELRALAREQSEDARYESAPGKYCGECYPDGWVLQTSMNGYPYKVVRRCACHG